jgi:hypothetical protein
MNMIGQLARLRNLARLSLAGILLAGVFAGTFPLATIASGPMCMLACCAGRVPHTASSCMNGSCHAFLSKQANRKRARSKAATQEQWCGVSRIALAHALSSRHVRRVQVSVNEHVSPEAQLSSSTITKPCQPDCGTSGSGFASSYRHRNVAVLAYSQQPRPPSAVRQLDARVALARTLNALRRHCAPRPPPVSFS